MSMSIDQFGMRRDATQQQSATIRCTQPCSDSQQAVLSSSYLVLAFGKHRKSKSRLYSKQWVTERKSNERETE